MIYHPNIGRHRSLGIVGFFGLVIWLLTILKWWQSILDFSTCYLTNFFCHYKLSLKCCMLTPENFGHARSRTSDLLYKQARSVRPHGHWNSNFSSALHEWATVSSKIRNKVGGITNNYICCHKIIKKLWNLEKNIYQNDIYSAKVVF